MADERRLFIYTLFAMVSAIEISLSADRMCLMPAEDRRLLVATNNHGKLAEFRILLNDLPVELISLGDIGGIEEVDEAGSTFAENAALKATDYARQAGLPTLADDSGLSVHALGGRPGVLSARYAGAETGFDVKMARLLRELENTSDHDRRAQFVAAIAIADSGGQIIHTAEGICPGRIALGPRGNRGFGYDPLFIPDGYDRTFGELPESIKREISHRARAFLQIMPFLRGFFAI
jgi:XTP/dITP diphosphohydrolase